METHVVTGAFSYTGKYIARRLLADGISVRTLTNHPRRDDPLSADIEVFPLDFDDCDALVSALAGAITLYNTYWIRFPHGPLTFAKAVQNSRCCSRPQKPPRYAALCTSASPTPLRPRHCRTSGAKGWWRRPLWRLDWRTPSSGPPWSSATRTS